MKPPFNTLPAVTTLIRLYKEGYSTSQLAKYFETDKGNCLKTLRLHGIPIRSSYLKGVKKEWKLKLHYKEKEETPTRYIPPTVYQKGKYDALFDEPVNEGKNYSELCQQFKIKIPKVNG